MLKMSVSVMTTVMNCGCVCVCHRGMAAAQTVLLTHGDSVASVAPGFTSCAQTKDKTVAGEISSHIYHSHLLTFCYLAIVPPYLH